VFLTSLNIKLENFEEECIKSIDSIFDAYFLLSKENIVLDYGIKDRLLNLYFGRESLQGKDFIKLSRNQTQQESFKGLIQKILEKKPQMFETNVKLNDQTSYYYVFIFMLADDQKLINFQNINKQEKMEQKLIESEEMYRNIFNSTPYAIWLVDLRGTILDCNETMNNFMSVFKHIDLIGKPFRDVLKMFLREGDPRFENLEKVLKERFKILLKQGYIKPIEFEISRADGKTFWITLESSFVNIGRERRIQTFIIQRES